MSLHPVPKIHDWPMVRLYNATITKSSSDPKTGEIRNEDCSEFFQVGTTQIGKNGCHGTVNDIIPSILGGRLIMQIFGVRPAPEGNPRERFLWQTIFVDSKSRIKHEFGEDQL